MAMNLRLGEEATEAVRAESRRSGRSQQEIIRDAVDRYLDLASRPPTNDDLTGPGELRPPRTPYRRPRRRLTIPEGTTTADLLDRADRL